MSELEALLLGLLQGLTEFLPVSSSGHLIMGKTAFGIQTQGVAFEVVVHAATVLSTITVFRKDIRELICGCFSPAQAEPFRASWRFMTMLLLSMLPILVMGLFFKDQVASLFGEGLVLVGSMLFLTAILLLLAHFVKSKGRPMRYGDAFVIGLSQAMAVLPGLSRSGTTIATGLLLGNNRADVARFSFLMVLVPILGEAFLELWRGDFSAAVSGIAVLPLCIGFVSAYLAGLLACSWMIALVKRAKLWGFSIYCALAGAVCLFFALWS